MIRLRPMRSDSAPNTTKNGMPSSSAIGDDVVGRRRVHLEDRLQIEERVELARVPDDALAGGRAEERDQHALQVVPLGEGFLQRLRRRHARSLLMCWKIGDSFIRSRM